MPDFHPELPTLFLSLGLCAFFAWLLRTRLGTLIPEPGLRLVNLFLAIQIFLIVINIVIVGIGETDIFPVYLWHLDKEFSIPSINSTMQLFLLCSLCVLTGFASGKSFVLERAYWLLLGIGSAGMTLVEFDLVSRDSLPQLLILPSGIFMIVGAVLIVLQNSNRNRRRLLLLLPAGLGIWAFSALVVDQIYIYSVLLEPLEETLETIGILFALIGVVGYASEILTPVRTRRMIFLSSAALVALLFGALAWNNRENPKIHFLVEQFGRSITVDIDDGALALRGWLHDPLSAGKTATFSFWLHATRPLQNDFGFTVQLLDQESQDVIVASNKQSDRNADQWRPGIRYSGTQFLQLLMPEIVPTNRALWLTLSFWKTADNEFVSLPVDYSDYPLLGDTHVILDELVLPQPADSISQVEAPGRFANGFVLYDASIPEQAQAGEALDVTFHWGTESAGSEDWIQFLHLIHEDSGALWNVDQMPLGARLPTRLWYAGLQSDETWYFTLPADLQAGRYAIYSGLYRLADLQRLGVTLADGTQPADARIPLGNIQVEG